MILHLSARNSQRVVSLALLSICVSLFSSTSTAEDATLPGSEEVRSPVRPFPYGLLSPGAKPAGSTWLIQEYFESVVQWGRIVSGEVRGIERHPTWKYLGLPSHEEDDVRPTAYAAMVLSFLAEFHPPEPRLANAERDTMRMQAIGLLRYLTASHVTGGATCVNGKPWGNQWQSAMWARAVGMAAWQMWPRLDDDLQEAVSRLVVFEADRFLVKPPKSSLNRDTGAEENAWNAYVLSLACNMMPDHPRAAEWEVAAKRYMYNTLSVAADAADRTPGDDGKPIGDWVCTINAHPDFTIENHGLVHVGYLVLTATELQENAVHWLMVGRDPPKACQHHVPQVFAVLLACMDWSGSPIYFAGNDWKIYQSQCSDVLLYCGLNLIARDPRAAYLEKLALAQLRKQQKAEKGFYNLRRDLEFGGLCATRIIMCCYAHCRAERATAPIDAEQFDRSISGVRVLPSANTVVHRTPTKFVSFSWAQKRMGLTVPRQDSVVWPHFASYLGFINGEDSSHRIAKLATPVIQSTASSFEVRGSLSRCRGQLQHDFYFASPAGDYTIYVERLRPAADFEWKSRETGVVGLEYPVGENRRRLYGDFGVLEMTGHGGENARVERESNWLNIDNHIGYVVCRQPQSSNIIRIHDFSAGEGRVPHLQEWFSLVGGKQPLSAAEQWACVVTFPNQSATQTTSSVGNVLFSVQGNRGTCRVGMNSYAVDFESGGKTSNGANR